jgi:hypothetical protein
VLTNPAGTIVYTSPSITAPTTLTYAASGAAAGVYTWTIYGQAQNNQTGDTNYSCSWSGTHSYYLVGPAGGNTYVLSKDGTTQRIATNDDNIDTIAQTASLYSFQVFNSAARPVSFTIAIRCARQDLRCRIGPSYRSTNMPISRQSYRLGSDRPRTRVAVATRLNTPTPPLVLRSGKGTPRRSAARVASLRGQQRRRDGSSVPMNPTALRPRCVPGVPCRTSSPSRVANEF